MIYIIYLLFSNANSTRTDLTLERLNFSFMCDVLCSDLNQLLFFCHVSFMRIFNYHKRLQFSYSLRTLFA